MESFEKYLPSTSKVTDYFKLIPFVLPSENTEEIVCLKKALPRCNLNGEEASQFYKEVISSPTNCSLPLTDKKLSKTVKKNITSIPDNSSITIFHHAQNGNIEGIKNLISNLCDINVQDMYGWTPLMCATFEGHYTVVEFLIKCGADLCIKNKQGLTAFDIAMRKKNKSLIELFKNGVVNEEESNVSNEIQEVKYCNLCESSYAESTVLHERSIAHLFSSRKDDNISTYYHLPENNKGFQIMLKKGWDKNKGLGIDAKGRKFPIKTVLKTDRICIGGKKEVPKVTHFGPNDHRSVKYIQPTLNLKRERKIKKSERKKLERRNRELEIGFRREFYHNDLC